MNKLGHYENWTSNFRLSAYRRQVELLFRWALLLREGVTWEGPKARKVGRRADGKQERFSSLVHFRHHVVSAKGNSTMLDVQLAWWLTTTSCSVSVLDSELRGVWNDSRNIVRPDATNILYVKHSYICCVGQQIILKGT